MKKIYIFLVIAIYVLFSADRNYFWGQGSRGSWLYLFVSWGDNIRRA